MNDNELRTLLQHLDISDLARTDIDRLLTGPPRRMNPAIIGTVTATLAVLLAAGAALWALRPPSGGGITPAASVTATMTATSEPSGVPTVPACDASTLAASSHEPNYLSATITGPMGADTTEVNTRVFVTVTSECTGGSWTVALTPGTEPTQTLPLSGPIGPAGPYPVGEQLIFTLRWPGRVTDPTTTLPSELNINGALIPVKLMGWHGGTASYSGPDQLSTMPHSSRALSASPSPVVS